MKVNRSLTTNLLPFFVTVLLGVVMGWYGDKSVFSEAQYWVCLYLISFCAIEFLAFFRKEDLFAGAGGFVNPSRKKFRIIILAFDFCLMATLVVVVLNMVL